MSLFKEALTTPWSLGLNVLRLSYQEKIYSGFQECVACFVSVVCIFEFPKYIHYMCWWRLAISAD